MPGLRNHLSLFTLALHRSTRVRVGAPATDPADAEAVRASAAHLPGAGWVVGLAACLVFALVALPLRGSAYSPLAAAVAALMATALLTGARSERGLFHVAEAIEPRAGLGNLALVLVTLAKVALLCVMATVSEAGILSALFAGVVLSRFAALLAGQWLAGENGRTLPVAALWCVVPLLLMVAARGPVFPVLALLATALACYALLRFFRARGTPGSEDAAGATQQVGELAFYLGAAIGV